MDQVLLGVPQARLRIYPYLVGNGFGPMYVAAAAAEDGAVLDFQAYAQQVIAFIQANQTWGPAIVFTLAFLECLAVISLLVPSTVILVGLGVVIVAGGLPLTPLIVAAACGAFMGDWLSFGLTRQYRERLLDSRLLRSQKTAVEKTSVFFEKYGWAGVFFGRFVGPLRATVPIAAGLSPMSLLSFQIVNALSAIAWAVLILGGGSLLGESLSWFTTSF